MENGVGRGMKSEGASSRGGTFFNHLGHLGIAKEGERKRVCKEESGTGEENTREEHRRG